MLWHKNHALTAKAFLVFSFLLLSFFQKSPIAANEPQDRDQPVSEDSISRNFRWLRELSVKERADRIRKMVQDVSATERIAAALFLTDSKNQEARTHLESLLKDTDMVVRRAAAETLFGQEHFQDSEFRDKYKYGDVLETESKAAKLVFKLSKADKKASYAMTRELVNLGWPAILEIRRYLDNLKNKVSIETEFAMQEILSNHANVPPAWAQEIQKKLSSNISFEFENMPFSDAVNALSKLLNAPIKLDERTQAPDEKISLSAKEMKASVALLWFCKLIDLEYVIRDGAIVITRKNSIWDGAVRKLLDVRDLERSGDNFQWKNLFEKKVPEVWGHLSPMEGTAYDYKDGMLIFLVPCNGSDPDGRKFLKPLVDFLNKLRKEKGLETVVWPIP